MDFSEGMRQIVLECFPNATITLDRFHMQQLVSDAMQELRLKHKKEEQKFQNEQRKLFKEQLKEKYERSLKQRHRRKESLFCSSAILTSKKHILSYTLYA